MDLIRETALLRDDLARLPKPDGIAAVYHPVHYAWSVHRRYLERYVEWRKNVDGRDEADGMQRRRIVIVGMNPGPWGMTQTGVPFGDVPSARRILGEPAPRGVEDFDLKGSYRWLHPKRPVQGFACPKTEVSGSRLWGGLEQLWGSLDVVLDDVFLLNLCPLIYFDEEGANVTPNDLKDHAYKTKMHALCDPYLLAVIAAMRPEAVLSMGVWVDARVNKALANTPSKPRTLRLPHPSPANPRANANGGTGWIDETTEILTEAKLLPR